VWFVAARLEIFDVLCFVVGTLFEATAAGFIWPAFTMILVVGCEQTHYQFVRFCHYRAEGEAGCESKKKKAKIDHLWYPQDG